MRNRIVLLVDNKAAPGLGIEHGFSIYIEAVGRKIIMDTGQGLTLESNAVLLGVDLAAVDTLVVSHGHYDHTGGIPLLLQAAGPPDLYLHPAAVQPRYAVREGLARAIQMPEAVLEAINRLPEEKINWTTQPLNLAPTIGLTGPIPRETSFEDPGGPFFLDPQGIRPDIIEDDQALWIHTDQGLVVCVGCCHAGLINTLRYVRHISGDTRIHGVVGGLHLLAADAHRLDRTIAELIKFDPDWIMPCHCTGDHAVERLTEALGCIVRPCWASAVIEL